MISELSKLVECSVCLSTCQEPVTLPCGHTFCMGCLQELIQRGTNGVFACPMDRYHFPTNYPLRTSLTLKAITEIVTGSQL